MGTAPDRQPAYTAVFEIIRGVHSDARVNSVFVYALVWHAVTAALDAMEPVWKGRDVKGLESAQHALTSAIMSYRTMADTMIDRGQGEGAIVLATVRSMEQVRDLIEGALAGGDPAQRTRELTREDILAVATGIHDARYGTHHCDRKYLHSCGRFAQAVLDAGAQIFRTKGENR